MKALQKIMLTVIVSIVVVFSLFGSPVLAADLMVRKNVVDLTLQEKLDFVNAIKTLKNTIPE